MNAVKRYLWIANALLILGAVLVSVSPSIASGWEVFMLFFAGHVIWVLRADALKDWSLCSLNAAMLALDAYAVVIRYA